MAARDQGTAVLEPRVGALTSVTVVLPCLDEAESVGPCVSEALEALADLKGATEVLVVDNGSIDGSPDLALAAGARVVHEAQRRCGAVLLRRFAEARGEVVTSHLPGSTSPAAR